MLETEYKDFLEARGREDTVESYIQYLRHISAYHYLSKFIKGKRVLEVGTLNGYGHRTMIKDAGFIVGFDLLVQNVLNTRALIEREHVPRLLAADCQMLPFTDGSFDSMVLFHVFEHLENPDIFLKEVLRVLRPGGKLFATTPNRKLRLRSRQKPYQHEHVREYEPEQFREAMSEYFNSVEILGLCSSRKEFLESERLRVQPWRNIFFAYFPSPFNKVVFTRPYQYFYKKRLHAIEALGKDYFTLQDCTFIDKELDTCIDIMAICTK